MVHLTQIDDVLELQVQDNGHGITSEQINDPKSFGLIGIRERVQFWHGVVTIEGRTGVGTIITVRLPLLSEKQK
jgi:signal transduction histidine kinase